MEASDLSVVEFRALGITQRRVAELFNVTPRHVRRWRHGDRRIPRGAAIVLRLLAAEMISIDQVERAAFPVPARTNGGAEPEPPAPLLVEPAPASAALVRTETATFADSGLSTAQKVL